MASNISVVLSSEYGRATWGPGLWYHSLAVPDKSACTRAGMLLMKPILPWTLVCERRSSARGLDSSARSPQTCVCRKVEVLESLQLRDITDITHNPRLRKEKDLK